MLGKEALLSPPQAGGPGMLVSLGAIGPSLETGLSLGWACGLREKDPPPPTHTLFPLPTSFPVDSRGSHSLAFVADPATAACVF